MKIMVLGSLGQLGKSIFELSENYKKHSFVFTDKDELDITNIKKLEEALSNGFHGVINCAAYTAVDKAETEKKLCYNINTKAVENIAKICNKKNMFMVHISTDYVFDGLKSTPYLESDKTNPISFYGKSKAEGEKKAFKFHEKVTIIRTSWLYSKYENNFVKTILRLLKERPEIRVVFDQTGTPTSAKVLAKIILDHIEYWANSSNSIYHFSNEGVASWYDFAYTIKKFTKNTTPILPIRSKEYPTLAKRPAYSVLDKAKIKTSLGINISHWEDSLFETINELDI